MPVSVEWTSRNTGKVVPVQKIDDEIRKYWELPSNRDKFSPEYQIISMVAIGSLMDGGSTVDKEKLEAYLKRGEPWSEASPKFFREFLLRRYVVSCWRAG